MIGDIDEMRAQLRSAMEELSRMPRHLAGSEWHADRVEQARWLTRAIERREEARRCAGA